MHPHRRVAEYLNSNILWLLFERVDQQGSLARKVESALQVATLESAPRLAEKHSCALERFPVEVRHLGPFERRNSCLNGLLRLQDFITKFGLLLRAFPRLQGRGGDGGLFRALGSRLDFNWGFRWHHAAAWPCRRFLRCRFLAYDLRRSFLRFGRRRLLDYEISI